MTEFLESIATEYYNAITYEWVDISAYVVGDIKGNGGLGGWRPDQRVAVLGTLNITLNNIDKLFSPMGGDAVRGLPTLQGWNKSTKIRIRGTYYGQPYTIWVGRIASIDSDDLEWGNRQTRVMAVGWMNVPSKYPMKAAAIELSKTIDRAMEIILARLSIQPEETDFDDGQFTFPAVFDNVQRKTMALSEFTKLANSELSYIYEKHDGTLRVENFMARHGWRPLDNIFVPPDTDSFWLKEDGDFWLWEDGGKMVLDEHTAEAAAISTDAEQYSIVLTEDAQFNASIIRVHPVITDTSLKVLYKLGTPLYIPSGKTAEFSAHYTDPNGLSQVSGTNMQVPVATTDYLANTLEDGSGTNETTDIVVNASYYGDEVQYEIVNNAGVGIYVTFLQARGYGIYYANSIESIKEDGQSQFIHGYAAFQIDQKYQKDTYLADMYGLSVIEEYKNAKSRITNMKFMANLNKNHMLTFLTLAVGSLILGTEDRSNISNHYYVTDRDFTIKQGGIINVEYGVKQNDSYLSGGLNPVTVDFGGRTTLDGINYGNLPHLIDLPEVSFSAWINSEGIVSDENHVIMGVVSDDSGLYIFDQRSVVNPSFHDLYFVNKAAGNGTWRATASFSGATLVHILVTYDRTSGSITPDPIVYINGASVTVTELITPAAPIETELGAIMVIGNIFTANSPGNETFEGHIFDPKMYNRILTAAEATELYNAGVPDHTLVTDGIVFQGLAVYADQGDADSLAGTVLSSKDRLIENALRAVGIPNGAPIIRANP